MPGGRPRSEARIVLLALGLAAGAVGCSSAGLPRTELRLDLRVAEGVAFEREWLTVTLDDGRTVRTVTGAEFLGPIPGSPRTERFVFAPRGELSVRVELAPGGVLGEGEVTLELAPNRFWVVEFWLDPASPVPCFGCVPTEIPLADDSLGVDTLWILVFRGEIGEGGPIT